MTIKLTLPSENYKEQVLNYKQDFINNGDIMHGTAGLANAENFETWLDVNRKNRHQSTVQKNLVPATTYLAVNEDDEVLGMIDIRHYLNEYLMQFGGHIGYSVNKKYRRQGVATKMLVLALEKCKELDIEKVLVTCDKENIGSAKTIQKCGGVLENEVQDNGRIIQRYWMKL